MPVRQTQRLRLGRVSAPGATYFVTCCTGRRAPIFRDESPRYLARQAWISLVGLGDVDWLAVNVMPDHVHVVFTLAERLTFSQVLGKAKATITRSLPGIPSPVWQSNAFEHRLRDDEDLGAYGFYVFMNPYVAGLVPVSAVWSGWACSDETRLRFLGGRDLRGTPPSEWLVRARVADPKIVVGDG